MPLTSNLYFLVMNNRKIYIWVFYKGFIKQLLEKG